MLYTFKTSYFPGNSLAVHCTVVKNLPANAGDAWDVSSTPGKGRSPCKGNGNPLQCSCLTNSMDTEAWRAAVRGAGKSRAWQHVPGLRPWCSHCWGPRKDFIFSWCKQMVSVLSRQLGVPGGQWWSCRVPLLILRWLWPSDMQNTNETLCLWLSAPAWPLTKALSRRSSGSALRLSTGAHSPQRPLVALWMASCASLKHLWHFPLSHASPWCYCVYTKPNIRMLVLSNFLQLIHLKNNHKCS